MIFDSRSYLITNTHIPRSMLGSHGNIVFNKNNSKISLFDIKINEGIIVKISPAGTMTKDSLPCYDQQQGLVFPCFVDLHTHLDKGHIWERSPNPDGTFNKALITVKNDAQNYWNAEDLYRRMEFGLKCSYVHGTKAIRTHLDSFGKQAKISFDVFKDLQKSWAEKLILQAVSLVSLDYYLTLEGEKLADLVAEMGGILGGVTYRNPQLNQQLDRVFTLAKERGLDLDFHSDESLDPEDMTLISIAEAKIRNNFTGQVICGHCCSLSVQTPEVAAKTIQLVKSANIAIVSLPSCNLYLQDRGKNSTPRYRGITLVHELKSAGIPVTFASDNCRDPFYAFGDHDMLEVLNMAVKIGHLDHPYGDWFRSFNSIPADLMNLSSVGKIGEGLPADLILLKARNFNELLSRSQSDRLVLRKGKKIDTTLPDYRELD
jgi:cytosine/creatinine deaminase